MGVPALDQREKPVKLSVVAGFIFALGLAMSTPGPGARADEVPYILDYTITLQVPESQRKLLEENLDLYRWRGSGRMNEVQLRRLVRLAPEQIGTFLATEGFYSPEIKANINQETGKWVVGLVVDPGETVQVTKVDIQVTGAFIDNAAQNAARLGKIRADWDLLPGMVFRQDAWETAKRNALKHLLLDRYPAARVAQSRATVNPEAQSVELLLVLDSGPEFSFGSLEVQGLRRYPESIVRRLNPIAAGEPYAQRKLLDFQARLQDSPYFESASVSVDKSSAQPVGMPVRVEVKEKPSQKVGFGVGASTNTGARVQVDYQDLNFLDRAWRLGSTFKLEQKRQSWAGDLQFPLTEAGHRDSVDALLESTDIEGESTRKFSFGAARSFVHGKTETRYGLRFLTEQQDIEGSSSSRNDTLSPSVSWTIRNLDNLLYPTRGFLLNLQADVAARALLSDQDFVRTYGRAVYFYPLGVRDQLILRGELGVVAAKSRFGIPSDFLFRTGGDQSLRGYAYQSIGVTQGSAIVGGRYLALASAEYVHWLDAQWGAAVFVDAGNAADSLHALDPIYGYGAGARWKSPVGPLNLDIAYGQETRRLRLHFSVGFSF